MHLLSGRGAQTLLISWAGNMCTSICCPDERGLAAQARMWSKPACICKHAFVTAACVPVVQCHGIWKCHSSHLSLQVLSNTTSEAFGFYAWYHRSEAKDGILPELPGQNLKLYRTLAQRWFRSIHTYIYYDITVGYSTHRKLGFIPVINHFTTLMPSLCTYVRIDMVTYKIKTTVGFSLLAATEFPASVVQLHQTNP